MNLRLLSLFLLFVSSAQAQPALSGSAALPAASPSPLLFVRFEGPEGMKISFYQGRARPRPYDCPVQVGLRPGYLYRPQISNLPNRPGLTLYPTLEVLGSLKLQPRYGAHGFPATVQILPEDIAAAAGGSLISKVVYLENSDRADPKPTPFIQELEVPQNRDLYAEARQRGRIMLVLHLGERMPTAEELASINVPGTILFPGEKVLSPARTGPCLPVFPTHSEEERIHDGGDRLTPAGFDSQGQLGGVDPEDTVAEYRDAAGRRRIVCSNRVCLCVPRFLTLRKECPLALEQAVVGPYDQKFVKRDKLLVDRQPSLSTTQTKSPRGFQGSTRPSLNLNVQGLGLLRQLKVLQAQQLNLGPLEYIGTKKVDLLTRAEKDQLLRQMKLVKEFSEVVHLAGHDQITHTAVIARVKDGPEIITATVAVRDLTACCLEAPLPPDKPLVLIKCADRECAKPGDIVTFTLRYSNVGGKPMTDVAVADSLSPRLEYVPNSAQTDRDAVFTVQENEAGSQLLRWEIAGTLQPGQTGRIRFQAKVR